MSPVSYDITEQSSAGKTAETNLSWISRRGRSKRGKGKKEDGQPHQKSKENDRSKEATTKNSKLVL